MFIQIFSRYDLFDNYSLNDFLCIGDFNSKYKGIPYNANPGQSKIAALETRRHSCIRKQNIKRFKHIMHKRKK